MTESQVRVDFTQNLGCNLFFVSWLGYKVVKNGDNICP